MNELTFDIEKHEYKLGDVVLPSVTQLLSEFKLVDFSGVPADRLEYKRQLGTAVHAAIFMLNQGILDEKSLDPAIVPYLDAYHRFKQVEYFDPDNGGDLVRMYSKKWLFAGSPDDTGILNDAETIIDYKCTYAMYKSTGAQLSGYEILFRENMKRKFKRRLGLLLKPTGHYELTEFKDKTDEQDFLACVHLHWQKRNKYKTSNKNEVNHECELAC